MPQATFPCSFRGCDVVCKRKGDLERHQRIHNPDRQALEYKCPHPGCKTSMLQRHNLNIHYRSQHQNHKWDCRFLSCSAKFSDPGARTRHMKRLHGYITRRQQPSVVAWASQFNDLINLPSLAPSPQPAPAPSLNPGASASASIFTPSPHNTNPLTGFGPMYGGAMTQPSQAPQFPVYDQFRWANPMAQYKPGPSLVDATAGMIQNLADWSWLDTPLFEEF